MPLKRTPPNTTQAKKTQPQSEADMRASTTDNDESSASTNVVHRSKRKRQECSCEEICNTFKNELCSMFKELKEEQKGNFDALRKTMEDIKIQNTQLRESVEFISAKYDDLLLKINRFELENSENGKYIRTLEEKIENLEKQSRSATIELRNFPRNDKETKEDLINIVSKLGKVVDESISASEIKDVFRYNNVSKNNNIIIIELHSVIKKEKVLRSVAQFNKNHKNNKLNTTHFGIGINKLPIFVSENLTPKTKRLYFLARDFATTHKYKYCWSSYGKIYLRKEDNGRRIRINSEEDLLKIESVA